MSERIISFQAMGPDSYDVAVGLREGDNYVLESADVINELDLVDEIGRGGKLVAVLATDDSMTAGSINFEDGSLPTHDKMIERLMNETPLISEDYLIRFRVHEQGKFPVAEYCLVSKLGISRLDIFEKMVDMVVPSHDALRSIYQRAVPEIMQRNVAVVSDPDYASHAQLFGFNGGRLIARGTLGEINNLFGGNGYKSIVSTFNEIVKSRTGSEIEKWLTHVSDTYEALHNDSETEKKAYLVDLSKAFSSSPKINPGLAKVIAGVTAWPSAFNYKDAPTAEYEAARNERLMGEDLGKIKSYRKKSVCFS